MGRFLNRPSNNYFKKMLNVTIIINIVFFLIGLFLFLYPIESIRILGSIIGVTFIINSILTLYKFLKGNGAQLYRFDIFFAIIKFILGVILLVAPYELATFVTKLVGIFVMIAGANKTSYGIWFKLGNEPSWFLTVTVGIMMVIFGLLLLIFPFTNVLIHTLMGIFMMVCSLLEIISTSLVKKRSSDIITIFW